MGNIETKLEQILTQIDEMKRHVGRPSVSRWLDTPPNTNTALFKAMSEHALQKTIEIITSEMPKAMLFEHTDNMLKYMLSKADADGAHAEFGVYSGRTLNLFADERPDVTFDGFDSFEGLPEEWSGWQIFDFDRQGAAPEIADNIKLHVGWFDETLPIYAATIEKISFMHVDCDIYSSTRTIFDVLGDKLYPGSIILFDEYFCYPGFEQHERKAFSEFLENSNFGADWIAICGQRAGCIITEKTKPQTELLPAKDPAPELNMWSRFLSALGLSTRSSVSAFSGAGLG